MKISINAQIEEVEYELEQRRDVYARSVAQRRMRQSVADMHVERMRAVLASLRWLQENETEIRAAVAAIRERRQGLRESLPEDK